MKKLSGFFSALALAALAVPFHASAQDMPAAPAAPAAAPAGATPLNLMKADARMVRVSLARQQLMGRSTIVDMGFGPALPAQFSSDGTTATIIVRGSDVPSLPIVFQELQVAIARIAITNAVLNRSNDLKISINIATGATEIEQMATGMGLITVRLGNNAIIMNRALEIRATTRSSTSRGPLAIATVVAANPTGGAPAMIDGAACAPDGSGFLRDAMQFSLEPCSSQIMVGGRNVPKFVNLVQITPKPFDPATGIVRAVGNNDISMEEVAGIMVPNADRFDRIFNSLVIREVSN